MGEDPQIFRVSFRLAFYGRPEGSVERLPSMGAFGLFEPFPVPFGWVSGGLDGGPDLSGTKVPNGKPFWFVRPNRKKSQEELGRTHNGRAAHWRNSGSGWSAALASVTATEWRYCRSATGEALAWSVAGEGP